MKRDRMKYQMLIAALFFILSCQSQSFTTRLYTTADGLSDNYIFSIYQDSYGYIWIGTANGLNRFDGRNFTTYGISNGLPSLFVDRIYEDHHHRLWIGTRNGIVELKGDSCYSYPTDDKGEIFFVTCFLEPMPDKLWATTNNGLYEFQNNRWVKKVLYPGHVNSSVGQIVQTNQGLFINYQNNQLIRRTPEGNYETLLNIESNRPYYNGLFAKNDTVYISTYKGLLFWDHGKWNPRFEDSLKKKRIYCSFADSNNNFWFGTEEDGVLVALATNPVKYLHIPLSINLVSHFFEDRDHNIWVAGFTGLLKVSPSPYQIVSLPARLKSIHNCISTPDNKIIVSDETSRLLVLKPATGRTELVSALQLKSPGDFIDYYTFDERQHLWFTTRKGDLYRLDGLTLTNLTSITPPDNEGLHGILLDKKRKKLFVCADSVLLTGNENHLDTFFCTNTHKSIPMPLRIFLDEDAGSLLVQTIEDGLFFINTKGEATQLPNINLATAFNEKNSSTGVMMLWATTFGNGIRKYAWNGDTPPQLVESISGKDGAPDNFVLDVALDKKGRLWIASSKGITVMQKNDDQRWMHSDLVINEAGTIVPLTFSRFCMDTSGNMWMNLQDKMLFCDAKETAIRLFRNNTIIEKVLLYDQYSDWPSLADSVDSYRRLPVNPVLRHDQNTLSIAFNGLQFSDNSLLEYSYRLLPSDSNWSEPTASNIVTLYRLAAGNYRFEVRSHARGFDWSEPAIFSFVIKKAFWETWLFRIAIILLASSLIVLIFRFRLRQLKARTEMQNQVREMELKALKAQMNPHFIHNALNSIQSLIINNRSNEASHYISKFAKLLRQVLENADKNLITLDKELYSLQLYVDLEKLRMNMDIDYSTQVNDNIIASEVKIPPLILQPFVENALWHGLSLKEGEKRITVSIRDEDGWIICEISDNGIGRKKAAEVSKPFPEGSFSKAVTITTQRLADFNQILPAESVKFVDLLNNNNEPAGTIVIVRIRYTSRN